MESDTALELVKKGATFLALDVPQYTFFGIDTQMFSAGPNFKGIKIIPPGIHFIYYSSSSREGNEFSPIVGFFISASSSQVIVRRWDQKEERLVKVSEEEEGRYSDAVKRLEFDKQLGPYTLSQYGDWTHLSNYITKDTVDHLVDQIVEADKNRFLTEERLVHCVYEPVDIRTKHQTYSFSEPIGGEITIACESEMVEMFSKTSMDKSLAEQLKNSKFSTCEDKSQKRRCYYTAIPRVVKQKGISGEDLTSLNLDKTYLLETILMKEYGGDEDALLGELQFAFIAFLMGQSLEAFLQWKLLLSLLLGCAESPLHNRSRLFTKFVKVLYHQLKFGFQKDTGDVTRGPSVDESWLSSDSFLHRLCKDFFSVVLEAPVVDGDLLTWTRRLKSLLEDSVGWKFQEDSAADGVHFDEDDEYAPVVENMDDTA